MKIVAKVFLLVSLIVPSLLLITGCSIWPKVAGSGELETREIDCGIFVVIEISDAFEADIIEAESFSVRVTADDNLFPYIEVKQNGYTLSVYLKPNRNYLNTTQKVRIEMPKLALQRLKISGASKVNLNGFALYSIPVEFELSESSSLNLSGLKAKSAQFNISGASQVIGDIVLDYGTFHLSEGSKIELEGLAEIVVTIDASVSSRVNLAELPANDVVVNLSGASVATINASRNLSGNLTGASTLYYVGNPILDGLNMSEGSIVTTMQPSELVQRTPEQPSGILLPIEKLEYVKAEYEEPQPLEAPRPETSIPHCDTAILGRVVEKLGTIEIENQSYNDYLIQVDRYLFNPLNEINLTVRHRVFWTRFIRSYIPAVGTELLLFLKKENDHYRISSGIYVADPPHVFWCSHLGEMSSYYTPTPRDEVLAKIELVAKTWADEELTENRKQEILDIAFNEPGLAVSLRGTDYQVEVYPRVGTTDMLDQKFYAVYTYVPNKDDHEYYFIVLVNMTQNKVEDILWDYNSEVKSRAEVLDIALSDATVKELIGNRGYQLARNYDVCWDSWQETWDDGSTFYIYPKVTIELLPFKSQVLKVFVDPTKDEVVKVIYEDWLSSDAVESSRSDQELTMILNIPKSQYNVGENITAKLSLRCEKDSCPIEAVDGQLFDLMVWDGQGNIVYHWAKEHYGDASPYEMPRVKVNLEKDNPATQVFQFTLESAGTYYVCGADMPVRGFNNWDFESVIYLDYRRSTYLNLPYLVVEIQ